MTYREQREDAPMATPRWNARQSGSVAQKDWEDGSQGYVFMSSVKVPEGRWRWTFAIRVEGLLRTVAEGRSKNSDQARKACEQARSTYNDRQTYNRRIREYKAREAAQRVCTCGYLAANEEDLNDHIAYITSVTHAERR